MSAPEPKWLLLSEVAALTGVSHKGGLLQRYCRNGRIPGAVHVPEPGTGYWMVPETSVALIQWGRRLEDDSTLTLTCATCRKRFKRAKSKVYRKARGGTPELQRRHFCSTECRIKGMKDKPKRGRPAKPKPKVGKPFVHRPLL